MPRSVGFENLRVYQLAEELADAIWNMVKRWDSFARDTVGKQVVRSADSVGANIAEGTGRGTYQDNRRFVRMARGSLYETRHWLRCAFKRKLITAQQVDAIKPLITELGPKLNAYLKSIGPTK
jgi:four helix bundle protein